MMSYSSALAWIAVAAQTVAWTAVRLHEPSGGLLRLPPAERIVAERLLRPELGPLFQGEGAAQLNSAIQSFRADHLNLGGAPSLAVQSTGGTLCGASGNCAFWIIDLRRNRIVLRSDGVQQFAVEQSSNHSFPNIITSTNESANESELIRWHFTGASYERAECATRDSADPNGNPSAQPTITTHPCDPEGN